MKIIDITLLDLQKGKYQELLPELYGLKKVVENSPWHLQQSVFDHILLVFEQLQQVLKFEFIDLSQKEKLNEILDKKVGLKSKRELLVLSSLLHDIAKGDTLVTNGENVGCPGHELIGASRMINFADRFDLDKKDTLHLEKIVRYHGFISQILELILETKDKVKYLRLFSETVGEVELELFLLMLSDLRGSDLEKSQPDGYKSRKELLESIIENF